MVLLFLVILSSQSALAVSYPLPPEGSRLVGSPQLITVPHNNTQPLEAFAAQYGQGLSNMLEANPGVDVFLPKSGTTLVIPQQLILPDTVREGIVVNVAEMRLYYYPPEGNTEVLPIGIGQAGRETPRNWVTTVERKQEAPTWTPTANTRREYARRGESLPAFVPAGPDNPMGLYAIYIGRLYAIHGTNANFGIGLRVSQGCIRLRNDDIKYLFDNVPVGTRVQIIDQPVKFTAEPDGSRWVEVHEPLSRNRAEYESDRKVPLPTTTGIQAFVKGKASM
jgi:L,D-transpeptidase ErfK/SrfK